MKLTQIAALLSLAGLLTACGERELILEGERLDLRAPIGGTVAEPLDATATALPQDPSADPNAPINQARPIVLSAPVANSAWTHRNGSALHRIAQPVLGTSLSEVWSASIGDGDSRKYRITADPVIADGRVFVMDARSRVSALSTAGEALWSRDLTPGFERNEDSSGGGLAVADGKLFATTGFGTLSALDAETGALLWTQRFDAPVTGAPTVFADLVYVVSRNGTAWAIRVSDGRIRWQLPGLPSQSVMVGGSGPAVNSTVAVFAFGSGDLIASFPRGGVRRWTASLAGQRRGRAYAGVIDITGDPVIDGDVLYAGSSSGRLLALDTESGERRWTATEGTLSPVWPAGDSVFLVSDQAELLRLDAATGERIWGVELPYYKNKRERRRQGVFAHYGPVLAGGRLVVASSDGLIRSYDPVDGSLLSSVEIPGGATTNPAIADGTLFVVSTSGKLHAFR